MAEELDIYVNAIYEELVRQSKDRTQPMLSDLALKQVNRAIKDAKAEFGSRNRYVGDLERFVAAGENPSVRDALLVLGLVRKAIAKARSDEMFGTQ
jgi:hypothetical protein